MASVNGINENCAGKSISELLALKGYDKQRVAVELNGDIIPKSEHDSTIIKETDSIEVVSFVGGG